MHARSGSVAAWVGLVAAYWLLRQDACHGLDAYLLLPAIEAGQTVHDRHVLYLHVVGAVFAAVRTVGGSAFDAMRLLAAMATATGVIATFWSWRRLGADADRSLRIAATAAVLPGVLHFGTIAEINAVTFAGGAVGFLAFVWVMARPAAAWPRLLLVGVVTALAAGLHSIGNLTPLVFALFTAAWPAWSVGSRVAGVAVLLLSHALCYAGIAAGTGSLAATTQDHADFVIGLSAHAGNVGPTLWYEWLYPFAPVSLLWVAAWSAAGVVRRLARSSALAIAGYLVVDIAILGPLRATGPFLPGGVMAEYGAYALAIVPVVTGLALHGLARRTGLVVFVVAASLGGLHWFLHRGNPPPPALATALAAAARSPTELLLVADHDEADAVVRAAPGARWQSVPGIALLATQLDVREPAHVHAWFDQQYRAWTRDGRQVLVSPRVLTALRASPVPVVRPLADWLVDHYELRAGDGVELAVLRPR